MITKTEWRTIKIICILLMVFSLLVTRVYAQHASIVVALRFNNQNVAEAKVIILSPVKAANRTRISVADTIMSGTKIIIPPGTVIVLRSPGGTQVVSSTQQAKSIEYKTAITPKRENHVVKGIGAQIVNTVKKILGYNYRNTNERGTTAASKGTEFTFTDLSTAKEEQAKILTSEGSIKIIDQVPCLINGKPIKNNRPNRLTTKSVSTAQSAGDDIYTSDDTPLNYSNVTRAIGYIKSEIETEKRNEEVDPEVLAHDLMCLGDLYMVKKQPLMAITEYKKAVAYFAEVIGDDDYYAIEARLSLAAAYQAAASLTSVNKDESKEIVTASIQLLEERRADVEADLEFLRENKETESEEIICNEAKHIYGYLGWGYKLAGDAAKSDKYYKLAGTSCN